MSNEPIPRSNSLSASQPGAQSENIHQTQIQRFLTTSISGTPLPFTNASVQQINDIALIRKLYKLPISNTVNGKKGGGKGGSGAVNGHSVDKDEEKERQELEVQILGIMALKGT